MRLLCPFCQKAITVPDTEAGKAVHCPECGEQFAAPQLYTPTPYSVAESRPVPAPAANQPPAPEPVPETYVSDRPEAPDLGHLPAVDRELSGYGRVSSFPLDPRVIRWIPAGALFLAFILTFFSWNGLFPGGYSAYTQSAWGALFASMSWDPVAEDALKIKDDLYSRLHSSWFLFFYLFLLFPTVLLAVAGPVVELAKIKLPPAVQQFWHFRPAALGVLCVLTLVFLLAQWASGFGLQRAVQEKVLADFPEKQADQNTPEKQQKWEMRVDAAKGAYHVRTTPWLRLALLMHLLAVAAVAIEAGLMLRGKKPPPRLAAMW
jgi:hypothetical protein